MSRQTDHARLDRLVAKARRQAGEDARTYRGMALEPLPRVRARCGRRFDGRNWEPPCPYCHDAEHSRDLDAPWIAQTRASHKPPPRKATIPSPG